MPQKTWNQVDEYFENIFVNEPSHITAALKAAQQAKLPDIQISAAQGKFLSMLIRMSGASRILEIGTLGGYSALWMAEALPEGGKIITLECNPVCAAVARANFAHASASDKVELKLNDALDSLKALVGEKGAPFDFIFIDANKNEYPDYLQYCRRLSRVGTIIIADNVVRNGEVIDSNTKDSSVQGLRAFNEKVAADPRLEATVLQTVGVKGYDGFAILRVTA